MQPRNQLANVLFEIGGVVDPFVGALVDGLAGITVERRLGIEAFHVADSSHHEQPDHTLGLRREVGFTIRRRP